MGIPGRALAQLSPTRPRRAGTRRVPEEHRFFIFSGRGWIDLLLRAWTSTAILKIRLVWCARSASKGDQPAHTPLRFPCAAFREHKRLTGQPCLFPTPGGVRARAVIDDRTRVLSHDGTAVVVDHQPLIPNALEQIRGEHPGVLGFIGLLAGDVFDADHPRHIARDLHHRFRQFKLH